MQEPEETTTQESKKTKILSDAQSLILNAAPSIPRSFATAITETLDKAGFKTVEDFEATNEVAQKIQNAIHATARGYAARIIQSDFNKVVSDASQEFRALYEQEVEARSDAARLTGINVNKNLFHLQQIISSALIHAAQLDASLLFAAALEKKK